MFAAKVPRVAVIGAGTMGTGIAGVFARAGSSVRLVDKNEQLLRRSQENLHKAQQVLQEAGLLSPDDAASARERIHATVELERGCEGVDLVIETISEDLAQKLEMFERVDRLCPRETVLASNTSGLSITKLALATERPQLVAGMHFFNPPHIVPLVEVTRSEHTAEETVRFLLRVARWLGKRPILVRRDVPGFVGNRLQFAVMREAFHLLAEGIASAEDIDTAMTAGPGLRYGFLGPLRTADLGGLDVFLAISRYLFPELDSQISPPAFLVDMVETGKLGAKAREGFYRYTSKDPSDYLAQRDRVLLGFLDVLSREKGAGNR